MSKELTIVLHYEVIEHVTVEDDYVYSDGDDERIEDMALSNRGSADYEFVGWETVGTEDGGDE